METSSTRHLLRPGEHPRQLFGELPVEIVLEFPGLLERFEVSRRQRPGVGQHHLTVRLLVRRNADRPRQAGRPGSSSAEVGEPLLSGLVVGEEIHVADQPAVVLTDQVKAELSRLRRLACRQPLRQNRRVGTADERFGNVCLAQIKGLAHFDQSLPLELTRRPQPDGPVVIPARRSP